MEIKSQKKTGHFVKKFLRKGIVQKRNSVVYKGFRINEIVNYKKELYTIIAFNTHFVKENDGMLYCKNTDGEYGFISPDKCTKV